MSVADRKNYLNVSFANNIEFMFNSVYLKAYF